MKNILLNPGPTNVHPDVKQSLITRNMNHRDPEFTSVMHESCKKIVKLLKIDSSHDCVPFAASGTGANEAMLRAVGSGKLLAICSGRYGQRLFKLAKQAGIKVEAFFFEPFDGIDTSKIEKKLESDNTFTHICFVHHETTTSIISPINELSNLAEKYNLITLVDSISSLFSETINFENTKFDFMTLTSNKCLESIPGLSFVIADRKLLSKLDGISSSFYFDLYNQWERIYNGDGLPRFTMPTQLFFALNEAVNRLETETVDKRIMRYRSNKHYLNQKMESIGFNRMELNGHQTANMLQMYKIHPKISYKDMHQSSRKAGITIYTDKENISSGNFFLSTMGLTEQSDLDYVAESFKQKFRKVLCKQ